MTFKESEHVNVIERLVEMSGSGVPMEEMVGEVWKLDRRIPLYPGIVIMCMNAVMEKTDAAGISTGEKIAVTAGEERITGTVKQVNGAEIILKDAVVSKNSGEIKVSVSPAVKLEKINGKTLEKVWPALVFENRSNR